MGHRSGPRPTGRRGRGGAAVLVVAVLAALALGAAPAGAASDTADARARRVLVFALPYVSWADLERVGTLHLQRFFDRAAVAGLSTRVDTRETPLGDGYATIGAGTRAVSTLDATGGGLGVDERFGVATAGEAFTQRTGVDPGLLSTCHRLAIPVFVGAPPDGSVFLNSMKLWAMKETGMVDDYRFELDLHAEVFEACAYHRWGLFESEARALATLILGGGVPKNYNLQPEPALGQILGLANVRGYNFDVQIVTAPVTDGSLSSCFPAEAVTWGKVDKDTYTQTTESLQSDYSVVMPFVVKALLDNRKRYETLAAEIGTEKLFAEQPKARGYLRSRDGYRLFEKRSELTDTLKADVRANREWLLESIRY